MTATAASCAVSASPDRARSVVSRPVPHLVHVRFDSFLIAGEPEQRPKFRMRLKPVSLDEVSVVVGAFAPEVGAAANCGFYANVFGWSLLQQDFSGTLRQLQMAVHKSTGVLVSIGAANSRVAAAAASRVTSPGELRLVDPSSEAEFLAALPVEVLHGIDGINASDLLNRGVGTIGELRRVPRAVLVSAYGDTMAGRIWRNSRGLDAPPEILRTPSVSAWRWLQALAAAFLAAL